MANLWVHRFLFPDLYRLVCFTAVISSDKLHNIIAYIETWSRPPLSEH